MGQFKFVVWLAYWYLQNESFEFEWDSANMNKSSTKHGVSCDEVESIFSLKWQFQSDDKLALRLTKKGSVSSALPSPVNLFLWSLLLEMEESDQLARESPAKKKGGSMKKSAKRLKAYDKIEFDSKEIIEGMSRLKGARRKPTSIALEEELLKELKSIALKRGVPYQVLMRLLIAEGVKRMKDAA